MTLLVKNSLILIAGASIGLVYFYANRITSIENEFINLSILFVFILLVFYFLYILKNPKTSIPFIICSLPIVFVEPAPCDILVAISIFAFILNAIFYNKAIDGLSLAEFVLLFHVLLSIKNMFYTDDFSYSLHYFLISFYLISFSFLISRLSDSYNTIRMQLNLYFIPSILTFFVLMLGFLTVKLNLNFGSLSDILILDTRAKGFFKDPNVAGPFLILPAIYSLATILNKRNKFNLVLLCIFFLSALGVFFTLSRAAIIALIFSIFFVLLLSINKKKLIKVISFLFIISSISVFLFNILKPNIPSRIYDSKFGIQDRIERIERGLSIFIDNPIFGSGMSLKLNKAPHDSYFLILSQTGVIGFLCIWLPIIYLIGKLLIYYLKWPNENEKIIFITIAACLLSHMIIGSLVNLLHWRHFWFLIGLAIAALRLKSAKVK